MGHSRVTGEGSRGPYKFLRTAKDPPVMVGPDWLVAVDSGSCPGPRQGPLQLLTLYPHGHLELVTYFHMKQSRSGSSDDESLCCQDNQICWCATEAVNVFQLEGLP